MNNQDSFADTIKPKSDQLNADDLLVAPITVKIVGVKRGPTDQPVHIHIEGYQPYKPSKSMRRVIIMNWGEIGADWVGKSMTLYRNPDIKFGGVALGGIEISHLSGISAAMTVMLTRSKGKKTKFTVQPLKVEAEPKPAFTINDMANQWIAAAIKNPACLSEITDPAYRDFIATEALKTEKEGAKAQGK